MKAPAGAFIRIGDAVLQPGRATGAISSAELDASWDLAFDDAGEPFHHLPYERLYGARLPRTKLLSPYPSASFSGSVRVGETEVALDAWLGMVGHNWGAEHAERWVWVQGAFLHGDEPAYFDMAAGRIRLGPLQTPWVANGMLRLGAVEHRLGGFGRAWSTKVSEHPTSCAFQLAGKGVMVRGRVASEARNFVAWVYADPRGPEHNTLNCSIADLELELERDGGAPERMELIGAAAYEFGTRLTAAFAKHHWCVAIRGPEGGGLVEGLPIHVFRSREGDVAAKVPTEVVIPDTRDKELSDLGFIGLLLRWVKI